MVTSAAVLLKMQPPTVRGAPKVGAGKPGLQGEQRGWLREETDWDPSETQVGWQGRQIPSPRTRESRGPPLSPHCIPQSPGQNLTHRGWSINTVIL